ncbi:MAG TPA: methionyl-tRNA formyltransferase [Gemmataceae bacterium]|jgi:methionyl-tRNA formyltransferase
MPRVVMMGTGTFARPTFEALLAEPGVEVVGLVTQPDHHVGHVRGSTRQTGPSLKDIAVERGVPVYQPDSVNTPEGVEQLKAWRPDLLVVAAYGQILKKDVLEAAAWGGINVHGSLLPKYRGAAPVAWAIYHGETRTGVTIIRMTTGLDAGDMLAQEALDILPDETAGELEARLAPVGARLAVDIVRRLAAGPVAGTKQDQAQVTKAPKLKKENGLIDWSQPAEQVVRQVRAMQPWPTAYTWLHHGGKPPMRVIVTRTGNCAWSPSGPGHPAPGSISVDSRLTDEGSSQGTFLMVATSQNTYVEIRELQPAGKRRMAAAEFLRGHPLHVGDRFGPEALP